MYGDQDVRVLHNALMEMIVTCFELDSSWGMLKNCQKNLKRWQRGAELILGNAEGLPYLEESFDTVLHIGGIDAFNDRAKAIVEMIRVTKAGTKIIIGDETAKLMESIAWKPTARKWLIEHGERFSAPISLIPEGMIGLQVKTIIKGIGIASHSENPEGLCEIVEYLSRQY